MLKITHIPANEEERIAKMVHRFLVKNTGLYFQVSIADQVSNKLTLKRPQGK